MNFTQGYKKVMENCKENARFLSDGLERTGCFEIISKEQGVPVVAFTVKGQNKSLCFKISKALRSFGWIVPAYTMPADADHITVLRAVVREDFGRPLVEKFLSHMKVALNEVQMMAESPIQRIRFTIELNSGEKVEDDDRRVQLSPGVVLKHEVDSMDINVPLIGEKTKGVC